MTHRGPFQPLLFCDFVIFPLEKSLRWTDQFHGHILFSFFSQWSCLVCTIWAKPDTELPGGGGRQADSQRAAELTVAWRPPSWHGSVALPLPSPRRVGAGCGGWWGASWGTSAGQRAASIRTRHPGGFITWAKAPLSLALVQCGCRQRIGVSSGCLGESRGCWSAGVKRGLAGGCSAPGWAPSSSALRISVSEPPLYFSLGKKHPKVTGNEGNPLILPLIAQFPSQFASLAKQPSGSPGWRGAALSRAPEVGGWLA